MKLYTRTGDDGQTGLFGGDRVAKHHPRVEAYGSVDELNATLGMVGSALSTCSDDVYARELAGMLPQIQSRLFDIGADLATPRGSKHEDKIVRIGDGPVEEMESWIDAIDGRNDPMTTFVLPGGTELAARLHLARTVCRRAERCMVSLSEHDDVTPQAIVYMNRLSDLLFAAARAANKVDGHPDTPWIPERPE